MKILILAAMRKELDLILNEMGEYERGEADGVETYRGRIGNHDVEAAICGIGKVNSAITAFKLIRAFRPELVVNSGVAGGGDYSMHIGDVLVASEVSYHDVWCGPGSEWGVADGYPRFFRTEPGMVAAARSLGRNDVRTGLICSGDRFITSAEEIAAIKEHFPENLAVDMESAPIAQVCAMEGVDFCIIRVMSDTPGSGDNISQYADFFAKAPEKSFAVLRSLLERY